MKKACQQLLISQALLFTAQKLNCWQQNTHNRLEKGRPRMPLQLPSTALSSRVHTRKPNMDKLGLRKDSVVALELRHVALRASKKFESEHVLNLGARPPGTGPRHKLTAWSGSTPRQRAPPAAPAQQPSQASGLQCAG